LLVIEICDTLSLLGALENVIGFGVGAVPSALVVMFAEVLEAVTSLSPLRAMTLTVYCVEKANPVNVTASRVVSDIHTAVAEGVPSALMYLLFQLLSLGEVAVTCAANSVLEGLLFALLSMSKVVSPALLNVGAEGVFAPVYA
jgi:uncharacterized MnhB-related membrane protein